MPTVSSYEVLQRVAMFGERRQQVLAENIANIDTPGYKTRDLDLAGFQLALQKTCETASSPAAARQQMQAISEEFERPRAVNGTNLTFHDGNNRSIEREMTELTKNLLMQNFAVELMSAQTNTLAAVISERV